MGSSDHLPFRWPASPFASHKKNLCVKIHYVVGIFEDDLSFEDPTRMERIASYSDANYAGYLDLYVSYIFDRQLAMILILSGLKNQRRSLSVEIYQ